MKTFSFFNLRLLISTLSTLRTTTTTTTAFAGATTTTPPPQFTTALRRFSSYVHTNVIRRCSSSSPLIPPPPPYTLNFPANLTTTAAVRHQIPSHLRRRYSTRPGNKKPNPNRSQNDVKKFKIEKYDKGVKGEFEGFDFAADTSSYDSLTLFLTSFIPQIGKGLATLICVVLGRIAYLNLQPETKPEPIPVIAPAPARKGFFHIFSEFFGDLMKNGDDDDDDVGELLKNPYQLVKNPYELERYIDGYSLKVLA